MFFKWLSKRRDRFLWQIIYPTGDRSGYLAYDKAVELLDAFGGKMVKVA
ncbi:MAG: hypothetical protein KAS32_11265 [Candidatus Peribacteraceae bacterium]|nr:hypothetical protein [Candidatus Peribacteraceae bacterium]